MEQAIRRILITKDYQGEKNKGAYSREEKLYTEMNKGVINADKILSEYSKILYKRFGTYQKVSELLELDRRTVKKYITG